MQMKIQKIENVCALECHFIEFQTKERKNYDLHEFRMRSIMYENFDLGEDLARQGDFDIRLSNPDCKKIENNIFDLAKKRDRYLVSDRVAFFNLARIKLPNIYYNNLDNCFMVGCMVMINNDGNGTITITTQVSDKKELCFNKNGLSAEFDLSIIPEEYLVNKDFVMIYGFYLEKIMENLKIQYTKEVIFCNYYKTKPFLEHEGVIELAEFIGIIDSNFKENSALNKQFIDLSSNRNFSLYLYNKDLLLISFDDNDFLANFIENYCLLEYFFVEKCRILLLIHKLKNNELMIETFYENYIDNYRYLDLFNFSWSLEDTGKIEPFKNFLGLEKVQNELLIIYEHEKIKKEISEKRIKEQTLSIQNQNLYISSIFTAMITTLSISTFIDILYGLEVPTIVYFPINLAKLIWIGIALLFLVFVFSKEKIYTFLNKSRSK